MFHSLLAEELRELGDSTRGVDHPGCFFLLRPKEAAYAVERLENIDDITIIKFNADDVVRHELVSKIVRAYDDDDKRRDD